MAMLPSPTAATTRLAGPSRTAPQAKMPGTLVSSSYGSRSKLPAPRGAHVGAREHVPVPVEGDVGWGPRRLRVRADEDPDSIRVVSAATSVPSSTLLRVTV